MKQLLDFLPLIIFFAIYKIYDIYIASGALIIATALQMVAIYLLYKKLEKTHIITFAVVSIFGTLTLIFHNDAFIKWKVTIIYLCFALALIISHFMKKPILKSMLGKEIHTSDKVWAQMSWLWTIFFIFCALLNIYVAFTLEQATWVNFKVFILPILTLINTIVTVFYLVKHIKNEQE